MHMSNFIVESGFVTMPEVVRDVKLIFKSHKIATSHLFHLYHKKVINSICDIQHCSQNCIDADLLAWLGGPMGAQLDKRVTNGYSMDQPVLCVHVRSPAREGVCSTGAHYFALWAPLSHFLIMIMLLFSFYTWSYLQIIMPKKKTLLNLAGDQWTVNAALHYHNHDDKVKMSSFDV